MLRLELAPPHLSAPAHALVRLALEFWCIMLQTSQMHRAASAAQAASSSAPKVSVVLPTRNRAYCLGEAIDSIRAQTFADWEMIVVDDGSEDDTGTLVRSYCARDSRIRYVRQPHGGVSRALNTGLRLARGDYLFKMDDDDVARPDLLAICAAGLDAHPDRWAVQFQFRHYEGNHKTGWNFRIIPLAPAHPLFFRTAALREIKGWNEFFSFVEDVEQRFRTYFYLNWRAVLHRKPLYDYRKSNVDNSVHRISLSEKLHIESLLWRMARIAQWGVYFWPLESQTPQQAAALLSGAHRGKGLLPSARFAHWQEHALEEVRAAHPEGFDRDMLALLEGEVRFPWMPLWRAERVLWRRLQVLRMPLMRRAEAMWELARNHYFRRPDQQGKK